MGHAGHELADRGHLLALDELHLGRLQLAVRGLQLVVGGAELLGADADLVLEPARQLLDRLEALGAVHGEGHVVRDRGEELEVGLTEAPGPVGARPPAPRRRAPLTSRGTARSDR